MKVTIIPNLTREHAYETTKKICAELELLKIRYNFLCETPEVFADEGYTFISENEIKKKTDVLIAVGGDGTMIRVAKLALPFNIPVLGVNAGKLAYLMGLESDELSLLRELVTKEYYIEERMVLRVDVYSDNNEIILSDFCINDAVFARGGEIRLSQFDVYSGNKFINRYFSDGLIVSTPTGSTAYNLAAGGPIVDPKVESIILSPICPHSLVERTVLFGRNTELTIENPREAGAVTLLSFDGKSSLKFEPGYKAVIKKADRKSKFIRLKDDTFMDILNKKMKVK